MKHKFFSLMVAACAALFTVSGLTGCGGGGGGDNDYEEGYVSVDDFYRGTKKFVVAGGLAFEVIPPSGGDEVWSNGTMCAKYCDVYFPGEGKYKTVLVSYTVTPRAGQDDVPVAEQEPAEADMQITFTDSNALTDSTCLAAFGGSVYATAFVGTIRLKLDFTSPGIGGRMVSSCSIIDGDIDLINDNVEPREVAGYFYVDRI